MRVRRDAAWEAFDEAMEHINSAVRLKQIRDQPIVRGRATVTLFERAPDDERPHPRLRMAFTELADPSPPALPEPPTWANAAEFRKWLAVALTKLIQQLGQDPLPAESPRYFENVLRTSRITALLEHARAAVEQRDDWSAAEREAANYAIAELGTMAYGGDIRFDDEDTGTYHSYLADQPFVHVIELLRASLPEEGTAEFSLLPDEQRDAIRRQYTQLTNHLDFLMRHKYALLGIVETDIERSLGGFLIDRQTRQIASEDPGTRDSLQPRHQLLRISPASEHAHAGAWVMRTVDGLALRDGTPVEVDQNELLEVRLAPSRLTFERAPFNPLLREGVRFDWNGDGWVDQQPLPWLVWAGHCDVKAVLEQIGVTMLDQQSVFEYRSDTGQVVELSRYLLLELLTAATELGSVYEYLDGSGELVRGIHQFGGARNDSLPDRLQFDGVGRGQHVRWPTSRERAAMQVTRIVDGGEELDLDVAFAHCVADVDAVDFSPNPRYLETVEGDYNVIAATGMVLSASIRVSRFDKSGQLVHEEQLLELDLRPEATGRTFLGTELVDPAARELHRVYLDRSQPAVIAELWRWDPQTGQELHEPDYDQVIPLASPLSTTLSREMKIDDPAAFVALLELALRRGQNICADTTFESPVWNGVVTRMQVERLAVNPAAHVERWRVHFTARFGQATLDFMLRRANDGTAKAYCPIASADKPTPDFLYQDFPDVASKAFEDGVWVVNRAMRERGIVRVRVDPNEQGGWYVQDDHVKNAFELLYAALAGYQYTIVHQNKRYVFEDEAAWQAARAQLEGLRAQLSYE
jgi:hypothetical protein